MKKFVEKMKRFWSLDAKSTSGFTLVELIVVIAVLAILAGIAVPAYSGYVEKANKQADMTMVNEIVRAGELAHYTQPLEGTVSIVLSDEPNPAKISGGDAAKEWLSAALVNTYGSGWENSLNLQYDGWGNGIAVAKVMLEALTTGDVATAMTSIYGNKNNLSFTDEIPALLNEIKDVAIEVAGGEEAEDSLVIGIVNGAADVTATWDVATVQQLWQDQIAYTGGEYGGYNAEIPANTDNFDAKLTIAGVVRAKNTCLALYAAENGYPQYYEALASFSTAGSIVPVDLTWAAANDQSRICEVLGLDMSNTEDQETLAGLSTLLNNYYTATGANSNLVFKNDAAAYYAMMGIVDTMKEKETLDNNNLDAFFDSVTGPALMFQELVAGTITTEDLSASLNGVTAGNNNITITFINVNDELKSVVGPDSAIER